MKWTPTSPEKKTIEGPDFAWFCHIQSSFKWLGFTTGTKSLHMGLAAAWALTQHTDSNPAPHQQDKTNELVSSLRGSRLTVMKENFASSLSERTDPSHGGRGIRTLFQLCMLYEPQKGLTGCISPTYICPWKVSNNKGRGAWKQLLILITERPVWQ